MGRSLYAAREADDPAAVLAALGRFAIVEGRVVSVRESDGTIYVNFAFGTTPCSAKERRFDMVTVKNSLHRRPLAGRPVRIRGVIEERGGPRIEVVAPGQIEIADR